MGSLSYPVPNMFPDASASQHSGPYSPYVGLTACLPIQNANTSLACCCAFRNDWNKHISRCSIHIKHGLSFYRSGPKGSRYLSKAAGLSGLRQTGRPTEKNLEKPVWPVFPFL